MKTEYKNILIVVILLFFVGYYLFDRYEINKKHKNEIEKQHIEIKKQGLKINDLNDLIDKNNVRYDTLRLDIQMVRDSLNILNKKDYEIDKKYKQKNDVIDDFNSDELLGFFSNNINRFN